MKNLFIVALVTLMFSCTSNDKKTTEETNNQVGVSNVNGNIPDTTNSINLSTQKKDTSINHKDSLK